MFRQSFVKKWAYLVEEGISQDTLTFLRTHRPPYLVKAPDLIGFFGDSCIAMEEVIYVRYQLTNLIPFQ